MRWPRTPASLSFSRVRTSKRRMSSPPYDLRPPSLNKDTRTPWPGFFHSESAVIAARFRWRASVRQARSAKEMPFLQARWQRSRPANANSSSHGITSRSRALSKRSTRRGSPPWRISLVIDSVRFTADITERSRAAWTFSHPRSRRTRAITAELSSAYRGCSFFNFALQFRSSISLFNFTLGLLAALGDQLVRPHFGWRSDATEVFLSLAHRRHPGFEHDPAGAAFRDTHRRARLQAEFFAELRGYQHSSRAIYFALEAGGRFTRHIPISFASDRLTQSGS